MRDIDDVVVAFRVDPSEGPSWLTFRCEEDLRESGLITGGDKVVALIELLALQERVERVEPVAYRYRFRPTSEAAGKWILVETLEEANPLPKYEIQPLYTAPHRPRRKSRPLTKLTTMLRTITWAGTPAALPCSTRNN